MAFLYFITVFYVGGCTTMFANDRKGQHPSPASDGVSIRVLWTVSGYKISENAVMREDDARKMLFKPLDIGEAYITFDGKTCRNIIFKKETVKVKEYLHRAYQIMPQTIGIDQETSEVIKTNCDLPGFGEYMRLKDRRLVIYIKGVFFFFEPAVTY